MNRPDFVPHREPEEGGVVFDLAAWDSGSVTAIEFGRLAEPHETILYVEQLRVGTPGTSDLRKLSQDPEFPAVLAAAGFASEWLASTPEHRWKSLVLSTAIHRGDLCDVSMVDKRYYQTDPDGALSIPHTSVSVEMLGDRKIEDVVAGLVTWEPIGMVGRREEPASVAPPSKGRVAGVASRFLRIFRSLRWY